MLQDKRPKKTSRTTHITKPNESSIVNSVDTPRNPHRTRRITKFLGQHNSFCVCAFQLAQPCLEHHAEPLFPPGTPARA